MLRNTEQYLDAKTEKEKSRLIAAHKAENQKDDDDDYESPFELQLSTIFTKFHGKYC